MKHELPFLDSMNPLQLASFLSGDYVSIFPSFLQPIARTILGQEQRNGVSGFLQQAQNFLGGTNSPTGGLLGGMGNLFSQAAGQGNVGSNNILSSFANAFGATPQNTAQSGGFSGFLRNMGIGFHEWSLCIYVDILLFLLKRMIINCTLIYKTQNFIHLD